MRLTNRGFQKNIDPQDFAEDGPAYTSKVEEVESLPGIRYK